MNEADYSSSADKVAPEPVSRRSFLGVLLGFGTVVMGAALSVPLIRFALHPLLTKTTDIGWSEVGKIDEFASLTAPLKKLITVEQRDGWRKIVSEKAIYVLPMNNVNVLASINNHRFVEVTSLLSSKLKGSKVCLVLERWSIFVDLAGGDHAIEIGA